MSVDTVYELFTGRQGRDDWSRHRTFTRQFEVYTTDPSDGPNTAGFTLALPRLGDPHPENPFAVMVAIVPVQDEADPLRWIVTIEYDSAPEVPGALQPEGAATVPGGAIGPGNIPDNPLARPTVWKVTFQTVQEVARSGFEVDNAGNIAFLPTPITNSAGFLYDPPIMIEVSRPLVTATRNVAFNPNLHVADVSDTVNSLPWRGIPPRCGRIVGAETESKFENGVNFWSLTYNIAVKWDTWDARPLDAGTMERIILGDDINNPGTKLSKLQAILDPAGNPAGEPVPLNGNGRKLAVGEREVYRRYSCYRVRDFNTQLLV